MLAQVPTIVVEDATLAPSKRPRLESRTTDSLVNAEVNTVSRLEIEGELEGEPHWVCSGAKSPRQICDDTIVCFGMVGPGGVIAQ